MHSYRVFFQLIWACLFIYLVSSASSALAYDISANETYGSVVVMKYVARIRTFTCFYSKQTTPKKTRSEIHPPARGFDSTAHYPPSSKFHTLQNNWG